MLDRIDVGRDRITGALERPLGRGLNPAIRIADADAVTEALRDAGVALVLGPETRRYRTQEREAGVRQVLVVDPDGYLLVPSSLGSRPARRTSLSDRAIMLEDDVTAPPPLL